MLNPSDVLGAMITPSVLISAAALLLLSTANRMGRVHDRLQDHLSLSKDAPARACPGYAQIACLGERLLLLRSAVIGLYLTIAMLVLTGITAGIHAALPGFTSLLPISVGLLGAMAFLYSIVVLIREASIAVRVTLAEITSACELARRSKPA